MGTIINHNLPALNSFNKMNFNNKATSKSMEKLSSGLGINRAADNAAGLAISEKMRGQIRGLDQAASNSLDAVSLIQTAEGGLNETHSILQRMRELAVQSSNGVYQNEVDREAITLEVDALKEEIDRIAEATKFNGLDLLNGKIGGKEILSGSTGKVLVSTQGNGLEADIKILGLAEGTRVTLKASGASTIAAVEWSNGGTEVVITITDGTTLGGIEAAFTASSNTEQAGFDKSNFNIVFTNTTTNKVLDLRANPATTTVESFAGAANGLTTLNANFTVNTREVAKQSKFTIANLGNVTSGITATVKASEAGADKNGIRFTMVTTGVSSAGLAALTKKGDERVVKGNNGDITLMLSDGATYSEKDINDILAKYDAGIEFELGGKATVNTVITAASFAAAGTTGFGSVGAIGASMGVEITGGTGTGAAGLNFQIGANGTDYEEIIMKIADMSTRGIGIDGKKVDVSSQITAKASIKVIDDAINKVASSRASLGAVQNRLESTINNLTTTSENLTASESRIRDVDMAKEMMTFTKMNILSQASQAMLAQANQQPQAVLQLLQ